MGEADVDPELLALLCCPVCRGDLHGPEEDELTCPACDHVYPIVDGIPVLLPTNVKARFEELFGRYWDSEARAELYDTCVEDDSTQLGAHNHRGELEATLEVLGPLTDGRLLDCGCGNGRFFDHYPESIFAVGIDASLNLLRICRAKGRCRRLVCGELEHLPFKDGVFDRTLSVRVLQHLHRQEEAVVEMLRVLRADGQTVLHLYNHWSSKTLAKAIRMSPRWQPVVNRPFQALHRSLDPFPPWELDYDEYNTVPQVQRWLERHGARVLQVRGAGFGFNKWLLNGFLIVPRLQRDRPDWLRRWFGWSLRAETALGRRAPFNRFMEKFVLRAQKARSG